MAFDGAPQRPLRERRADRLMEQVFTGLNVVVFGVLISCVAGAAFLWERWH
jgi:hypothetical protein